MSYKNIIYFSQNFFDSVKSMLSGIKSVWIVHIFNSLKNLRQSLFISKPQESIHVFGYLRLATTFICIGVFSIVRYN